MVADELQNSGFADMVGPGGAVLTGGGSLMRGTAQAAEQILGLTVRPGLPHPDHVTADERWLDPVYATAMGLLSYSTSARWGSGLTRVTPRKKPVWMRKLSSIFEDLF